MNDSNPSEPATRAELLRVAPWILSAAIATGGVLAVQEGLVDRIGKVEQSLDIHIAGAGHAESMRQLAVMRSRLNDTQRDADEVRAELATIRTSQVRILRRLDAICAAAPGCSPQAEPIAP